jgi:hypothetical protein
VDLDGDGQTDLLSGSWPGELFFFRGDAAGDFAAPEMLKGKSGEIINVEGGIKEQPDGMILITGHAEWDFDSESGKNVVVYRGKRYESTAENPVATTGCAAHVNAADWDGDGDFDLLVGTIGGSIYLIPNEGSATEWAFGEARKMRSGNGDSEIRIDGDAAPLCVDWDGDGDLDLLTGGDSGAVWWLENTGTSKQARLGRETQLISEGLLVYGEGAPKQVVRGGRSKLAVTDWNGDGRLDLLVGDVSYQRKLPDDLPPDEAKRVAEAKAQLEVLHTEFGELVRKIHGPERVKDDKEMKALSEKMQKLQEKMAPLQELVPEESVCHGSVWLFLQKAES